MPNDVLIHGLEVVFCGITDRESSSDSTFFYDRPGNNFFCTKPDFTPIKLRPEQSSEINQYQIGLSNLKEMEDADDVENYDAADFVTKMLDQRPRFVAFTCRKAAACCLEYLDVKGTVNYGPSDIFFSWECLGLFSKYDSGIVRYARPLLIVSEKLKSVLENTSTKGNEFQKIEFI